MSKTFACLWVNVYQRQVNIGCRRPGSTPAGGHPATLHGGLRFRDGFDDRSATQALYVSAARILPAVGCTNDVTVPATLPDRDPRMT
ncbi:hypothetical protein [Streptomyces tremellae]|uniref:hypothetical protein n=1 Tax=Streptomyces tremellae TaxID=1124239 RepID=UPI0031F01717